ncbi:ATP-binding cassette sub-family A member 3 [Nymphaea thermarum]|nr:ATP-binding cassette sub-family A member 3 [Nymphaea thermarum]
MEMERKLEGFPLFMQQFTALLKKNFLLSWRKKRATSLVLMSSFIFMFIIFCSEEAYRSRLSSTTYYDNALDPPPLVSPPIPPCEEKITIKLPCFDFAWSGNGSKRISAIVHSIMKNNPGRPIPSHKVKSFETASEVDQWLYGNPMHCPGTLHFFERNSTVISYGIQTNSTTVAKNWNFEDPTFKFQIPLQIAAEREIARSLIGDDHFNWTVGLKEFAHPALELLSAVGGSASLFLAAALFGFEFQMSSLVAEKDLKLRQALTIMGLFDSAYWLSWLVWEICLTLLSSLLLVLFGMMFQLRFFLKNSFGILFFLFFLFQFNMASSTGRFGLYILIIGFITQPLTSFGFPYRLDVSKSIKAVWSLFSPNLLAEALALLGHATATPLDTGISWSDRAKCPPADSDCSLTIVSFTDGILKWLISTSFLWFILAIYFDNIFPNPFGVRKPCFYFMQSTYWTGKGGNAAIGEVCSCMNSIAASSNDIPDDEDVLVENTIVRQQAMGIAVDENVAVQIRGLRKSYRGKRVGCCERSAEHHAVKELWLNFSKDQLFCLLGPNGAGKTTVINCLTGTTLVTGGDALIYGYSIRSSADMLAIRRMIGVCPQFDVLWDTLSAEEHLELFARIKGLSPGSIKLIVEQSLEQVKLTDSAKMRVMSFSGGMKRRLSVAIALIGEPKLLFLDEPTTGMDPIARRHVWDIIEDAKKRSAIILTTHSMEEADILGDRIAIMARGKLCCIGTSIRLKSRFGAGYVATVSSYGGGPKHSLNGGEQSLPIEPQHELVKQFFKEKLDVEPKEETKAFLTFVIPHEKEALLADFFVELQEREQELGISDIQLGLTTLEEVFLNIAKKAELEYASSEGNLVTLNLSSGPSIEISKGARFVGIPGTESGEHPRGVMVEVYWQQDDTGELCISGHSEEIAIPPMAQEVTPITPATSCGFSIRRRKPVVGTIIYPEQVQSANNS